MRCSALLCIGFACLLATRGADANKVEKLEFSTKIPAMIWVYSTDGEKWTDVDESKSVQVRVNTTIECQYEGKASGKNPYGGELRVAGLSLTSGGKITGDLTELTGVYRYVGPIAADPVKACNRELDKRVAASAGKTRYHFLKDGFEVASPGALKADLQLLCRATGLGFDDIKTASANLDLRVNCKSSALAAEKIPKPEARPARATAISPLVKSLSFTADPPSQDGSCPAGVAFEGQIVATRAGEVQYQYEGSDGNTSPVFTLSFKAGGARSTAGWHRTIDPRKFDKGRLQAPGASNDVYEGWQRLTILSPEKSSRRVSFSVRCR